MSLEAEGLKEIEALKCQVEGYQKRVCSMCDGHGMIGNIIDSIDCPDCEKLLQKINNKAVMDFIHLIVETGQLSGSDNEFLKSMYYEVKS